MKKDSERATVEAFLRFGDLSDLSLRDWNHERPDALIKSAAELIGVEVTTITEANPRQATAPQKWWAEATRIVATARGLFEGRNSAAPVVAFEMHPAWRPPNRDERPHLASDLATIVEQTIAKPPAFLRPGQPITLNDPHPAVSWLYIADIGKELGGDWRALFAHEARSVSAADIRTTVARKDPEVETYRKAAPTVWLLINCGLSGQGISLNVPTPDFVLDCQFNRVFCCGFGMWQWVEIPTIKRMGQVAG